MKKNELYNDGLQPIISGLGTVRSKMIEMGANNIVSSFKIYIQELKELLIALKDVGLDINRKLKDPLYKIFDDIKNMNVEGKLNELIEKIPTLSEMQSSINSTINIFKAIDFQEIFPEIVTNILNLTSLAEVLLKNDKISNLANQLPKVKDYLNNYLNSFQSLEEMASKLADFNCPNCIGVLNSTLYGIISKIDELITQFQSINTIFPSTSEINSKLSNFKSKFKELKYGNKLNSVAADLCSEINKFLNNNELIEKMKEQAESINAFFSDLNTTQLIKEFNDYIDGLKKLYNSTKYFNKALAEKLKESLYPVIELVKSRGGQPILDKLSELPNLPQKLLDIIKQLQSGEFQMDKITGIFDKINSELDVSVLMKPLLELLTKLKTILENSLSNGLVENVKEKVDNLQKMLDSNKYIKALNEYISSLNSYLNPLVLQNKEKLEKKIYPIVECIKTINTTALKEQLMNLYTNFASGNWREIDNILSITDKIEKIKELFKNETLKKVIAEKGTEKVMKMFSDLKEKITAVTGDFSKKIHVKLEKIRDIIGGEGVIDALEEHINAIKSLAFDFKDEENFENYKESLGNLVRALNNVPCEELISSIFSALLEIKDEVFGELMNILKIKTSLEKLLNSKGLISDSFNKLLEELEPEIKKLKSNEKLAPIIKNLEELREEIKQKLNASHITETIEQYIDGLKNLKDKLTVENIKKKIERGLYTCDTEFIWKLGKISEIETIVNNIIDDFEKSKIKNIIDNLQKEATEEIKALIDNMKPKIEKRKEKIQEKLKEYLNDPRFEPLVTNLKKFSDALEELKASFGKIKEMEKFKIFKEKIDKLKKVIKEIEQSMKIIQIKEIIYNLKNKIKNLDFKGKLNELN